jgi:hypothetical protein
VVARIKALFLLAVALVATLIGLVGRRTGRGIRQFRAQYDPERLSACRPGELDLLFGLGRCIGCGLCDRGEAGRIAASRGTYPGTMPLILNSLRNTSGLPAAAHAWGFLSLEVLDAKQLQCPSGVPLAAVLEFVNRKVAELGGALALPSDAPPDAAPSEHSPSA